MSRQPNKTMIGIFTLIGLGLFVGMLLLFLGDKIFVKQKDLVVFYFSESIKGLSVGSSVVLKGVEIGKVMKIDLIADDENLTFKIPVYVKFNSGQIIEKNAQKGSTELKNEGHWIDLLVKKGLRGRLTSQNLLTGQLIIELVFMPDTPEVYQGDGRNIEIPTTLSSLGELSNAFQDLPIRQSLEKLNTLMDEGSAFVNSLNKVVSRSKNNAADTVDNLNKTIRDVGEAAQALRNFADYIERHPEALLRGKGKY